MSKFNSNQLSRSEFLKLTALASAGVLLGTNKLFALPNEANKDFHHFKIGAFKCTAISDGTLTFPSGFYAVNAKQEEVEKVLREHKLPEKSVTNQSISLVVNTGKNLVLIDTGMGEYLIPGMKERTGGKLQENLKKAGIRTSEIDTVILTHAHPDHIAGVLTPQGVPAFANATYYIWKGEWDYWIPVVESTSAEDLKNDVTKTVIKEKLAPLTKHKLVFIDKEDEIVPGIKAISSIGHTPGHITLEITSGKTTFLHTVDVAGHFVIATEHPDWYGGYDMDGTKAMAVRRKILDKAADNKLLMMGYHFPFPGIGHIAKNKSGNNWDWHPIKLK
jgi:glyoxylase-like metal-dependent hydrolase (beta-lactamase superfamily II)